MYRKLVINVTEPETRVALVEDGTMSELMIERRDDANIAGNVYKGMVCRVLPGMQAAFLDIGLHQSAFIHVSDLNIDNYEEGEDFFSDPPVLDVPLSDDENLAGGTDEILPPGRQSIEDIISEGQEILVQVAKSPLGSKGARVTSNISLPGRFLVLMPHSDRIGVSRRIEDEKERERLKETVFSLSQGQMGYIVRTAAEGIGEEKLAYEMGFLKNLWENVQIKFKTSSAPSILHKELNVSLRAVRDLLTHEADKVIIDSLSEYRSVLDFLDGIMPSLKSSVELYAGSEPIFDAFNLIGDISRALNRKVWLKSGGYIVLEHTEALMAIDVNTGRYVGKHNLEAVKEIAYQIRLRDIGGIIIIDFIDMERKSNQEKVFNALKGEMKKDKSKTHILPISEMGLVQMTRKRIREPLPRILCEPCFYCDGKGYLLSKRTICYNIYRDILRESRDSMGGRYALRVHPDIAELLHGEENYLISSLERTVGKHIVIYPDEKFHMEQYDILEILKS
jgi:ribonuclease G